MKFVLLDNTHFKRKRSHKIERSLNCTEWKSAFNVACEHRILWLARLTLIFSQNKSDGYMSTQLRQGSLGVITSNASSISCRSLLILWFSLKISQMVICPVRGTYNHVTIFLFSRTKKTFKLPSRATFVISKFPYFFRVSRLSGNFNFFLEFVRWWQVQSAVNGTTRLIWPELTHSTIFLSLNQLRHGSLGVIMSKLSTIWFARHTLIFSQNKSDGYMPVIGTYNHVTIFLCLRTKKSP